MSELTQATAPSWIAWLTDYDKAVKVWLDSWHALKSRTAWIEKNAPHLLPAHKAVMQRFLDQVGEIDKWGRFRHNLIQGFATIGTAIKNVGDFTGINSAVGWVKGALGLNGYNVGLGAAQVVWLGVSIASAAALVAAMAATANDGFKHVTKIDAYKLALEKGATPQQAASAINAAFGDPNDQQFLGLPIREALIAAVLIVLGPPLVKAITERKK